MNPNMAVEPLLKAARVSVSVPHGMGIRELVHDATFSLQRGEVLVILGESGCGKTLLSRALTKLFPISSPLQISGSVQFDGRDVMDLDQGELTLMRRRSIRYVFQEPILSLNPLAKVRTQLSLSGGRRIDDETLVDALAVAGLDNPREVLEYYPHQLSVGMAQRVCIAMATLPEPQLLIADEPTSAVDASLRYKLLDMLMSIHDHRRMSVLLITHDINIARRYGHRIIVMYAGRIVEVADRIDFFSEQWHPYSKLLIGAHSSTSIPEAGLALSDDGIPVVEGCRFHLRCPKAKSNCKESEPEMDQTLGEREVRCLYWK